MERDVEDESDRKIKTERTTKMGEEREGLSVKALILFRGYKSVSQ